jgi:hypothetical protein
MPEHYLLRVGDGEHFKNSSPMSIWGIDSSASCTKGFIKTVKEGDILWFVKSKSNGHLIAVATFTGLKERVTGPLIDLTPSNEELGWTKTEGDWDIEVHYTDLYNIGACELYSGIKSPLVIRKYSDKCACNLPAEYASIVRYSKVTRGM